MCNEQAPMSLKPILRYSDYMYISLFFIYFQFIGFSVELNLDVQTVTRYAFCLIKIDDSCLAQVKSVLERH